MAKTRYSFKRGGRNVYAIGNFLKPVFQVNGLVRPEKITLLETALPPPCTKKDIFLYRVTTTGLVQPFG
jgi:hypothetical protein